MEITEKTKRLLRDKTGRMNKLYKIVDKHSELITFEMNEIQSDYHKRRANKNITLKSRQLGFTTYECIDALDEVLFNKNFNAVIIAHEQEALKSIFRKVRLAWDNFELRDTGLWKAKNDNANELSFNNGSIISVALSTRSSTVNKLHISEFGKICRKYPLKALEIVTGAFPSVPDDGRISIESTAEGEEGRFAEMFWEAWDERLTNKGNGFKAFFYPWSDNPKYVKDPVYNIPRELREYQAEHNLSDGQIAWYFTKSLELKDKMKQENPTIPEEAFQSSGDKVFDVGVVNKMIKRAEDGITIGDWTYFSEYKPDHQYALAADVSEGIGRDSSTCIIIDFSHRTEYGSIVPRVVARYKSNKIAPDIFAHEIANGGRRYGECLVTPERNNHGHATLAKLKEIYTNIYTEKRKSEITDKETKKLGWYTTGANKPLIIFALKSAIENYAIDIPDKSLLRELRMFGSDMIGVVKYDEDMTNHYDLLMALAICYEMRNYVGAEDVKDYDGTEEPFDPHKAFEL